MKYFAAITILLLALMQIDELQAKPISPEVHHNLEKILAEPQFQPREDPKSFWQDIWEEVSSYLLFKAKQVLSWLESLSKNIEEDSWVKRLLAWFGGVLEGLAGIIADMFRWIRNISLSLLALAYVVIGVFAIYLFFRLLSPYWGRLLGNYARSEFDRNHPPQIPELPLEELVTRLNVRELLEAMRVRLRNEFLELYNISLSASDRAAVRQLPKNDSKHSLFKEIIEIFEQAAFAKQSIPAQRVKTLCQHYLQLEEGGT